MTDAEREQPPTRGDVYDLGDVVQELAAKFKWQMRLTVGLIAAVVGVFVALALGATALVQVRHENACVASLAAASADRTSTLAPLNTARLAAADVQSDASANLLYHAITSIGLTPAARAAALRPDTEAFTSAHESYVAARDAYNQAVAAHPPPKAPTFHC